MRPSHSPDEVRWIRAQRLTSTTSYVSAVGGKPVSNFALTAARRSPQRATVVGISKAGSVITFSTVADIRSGDSRNSVI